MGKGHITRKELKHDVVWDTGESLLEYLSSNRTKVLTYVLLVVGVGLALRLGLYFYHNAQAAKATELATARNACMQATLVTDPSAIDSQIASALDSATQLETKYGLSGNGLEGTYLKGNCFYLKMDFDGAISAFQTYIDRSKAAPEKAKGYLALGYALSGKAFMDPSKSDIETQARRAFEKARDLGTDPDGKISCTAADAMMNLAEMDADKGNYDEAMKIYQKIVETRSIDADLARFKTKNTEKIKENTDRAERIEMVREGVRKALDQFSYQRMAEERMAELKTRVQTPATPATTTN